MFTATLANEETRTFSDEPTGPGRRFSYSQIKDGCLKFVIVDVGVDGKEEWSEQEWGEVCWYAFEPSPMERRIVFDYIESGLTLNDWTRIIEATE